MNGDTPSNGLLPRDSISRLIIAVVVYSVSAWCWLGAAVVSDRTFGADFYIESTPPLARPTVQHGHQPILDVSSITIDYPRALRFARGVKEGRLDLWNRWVSCGAPLWAEQGEPFFPLNLPFYLAPIHPAYNLAILLRIIVLAIGAFVLARTLGVGFIASLAAGLFIQFSGASLCLLSFGSIPALGLVPWAVAAGIWTAEGTRRQKIAAVFIVGVCGQSGHPASLALVGVAFGCGWAGRIVEARRRIVWRVALQRLLFVALIGAALTAPRVLPGIELLNHGTSYKTGNQGPTAWNFARSEGNRFIAVSLFSANSMEDLIRIVPNFWPWRVGLAQALLVFVLAFVGLLVRVPIPIVVLGAAGLILSTGGFEIPAYRELPGATMILPSYSWMLVTTAVTIAAAKGLQAIDDLGVRKRVVFAFLILAAGAYMIDRSGFLPNERSVLIEYARWNFLITGALIVVAFVVGRWRVRTSHALALGAAVQGMATFWNCAYTDPAPSLDSPDAIVPWLAERAGGAYRMHAPNFYVFTPNTPGIFDIQDVRGSSPLPVTRFKDFLEQAPGTPKNWVTLFTNNAFLAHLDLMAARYVIVGATTRDELRKTSSATIAYAQGGRGVAVFENSNSVPRARMLFSSTAAPTTEVAARMVRSALTPATRPLSQTSLWTNVIVEPAEGGIPPPDLRAPPTATATVVHEVGRDPDTVVVRTESEHAGYLVLADTYYPGWNAFIDETPTPIHPANLAFRAVHVPAGRHVVRFEYTPRSFWGGVAAMSLGLLVLLVYTLYWSRRD